MIQAAKTSLRTDLTRYVVQTTVARDIPEVSYTELQKTALEECFELKRGVLEGIFFLNLDNHKVLTNGFFKNLYKLFGLISESTLEELLTNYDFIKKDNRITTLEYKSSSRELEVHMSTDLVASANVALDELTKIHQQILNRLFAVQETNASDIFDLYEPKLFFLSYAAAPNCVSGIPAQEFVRLKEHVDEEVLLNISIPSPQGQFQIKRPDGKYYVVTPKQNQLICFTGSKVGALTQNLWNTHSAGITHRVKAETVEESNNSRQSIILSSYPKVKRPPQNEPRRPLWKKLLNV